MKGNLRDHFVIFNIFPMGRRTMIHCRVSERTGLDGWCPTDEHLKKPTGISEEKRSPQFLVKARLA